VAAVRYCGYYVGDVRTIAELERQTEVALDRGRRLLDALPWLPATI
jgi:hypothetical protein